MKRWLRLLCACVGLTLASGCEGCIDRDRDSDDDPSFPPAEPLPPPPPSQGPGGLTSWPRVRSNDSIPIAVTLHVGVSENVSLPTLRSLADSLVLVSQDLWNVTEGQIRIGKISFWDNVAPGTDDSAVFRMDTSNFDVLFWPADTWACSCGGFMVLGGGRTGRCIALPFDASLFVMIHEVSHLLFELSWTGVQGPILVDEYADGTQDSACIMDLSPFPLRWCWTDNHASQTAQPHSCWEQILRDYPNLAFTGSSRASSTPPDPELEFHDAP